LQEELASVIRTLGVKKVLHMISEAIGGEMK
jgi:hypothetical protein